MSGFDVARSRTLAGTGNTSDVSEARDRLIRKANQVRSLVRAASAFQIPMAAYFPQIQKTDTWDQFRGNLSAALVKDMLGTTLCVSGGAKSLDKWKKGQFPAAKDDGLLTLEDIGLCEKGQVGRFIEEHDFTYRGDYPLNTHGGQLSFGQPGGAGGMSHVTEAVRQLQGRAGERQLKKADHAIVNGNGGIIAEQVSLILGRD